jgi:uncharacterized protein (TIGR03435 family)
MARFPEAIWSLLVCCGSAVSQTPGAVPAFEVASVKVAVPFGSPTLKLMHGGPGTSDPTRFTYSRANLANLVMLAFGVRLDQITGPDWVKDSADSRTLYAIDAVVPPNTSKEQFDRMLQALLAERFHLAIHHEAKEFAGYELVVADGGPKLKECLPEEDSAGAASDSKACPALPGGGSKTTSLSSGIGYWGTIRQRFIMPMPQFAEALGPAINESKGLEAGAAMPRVADKTGLTGTFDFTLSFTGVVVVPGMTPPPAPPARGAATQAASDPGGGPSLASALEKQLGLKLLKAKNVLVDIIVIDHADKVPAAN